MTNESQSIPLSPQERREKLRQLGHDVKTYLGVVTMGLQALDSARNEPDEFAELYKVIESDGVQPLKRIVSEIVNLACAEQ